jgi:DNA-binding MarR family transcriptional regulator
MPNPSYSDLIQQLSQAESQVTRRLAAVLAAHGDLTVDQWRVLDLLSDGKGQSMRDVSEFALLPAANTTRLIDRMTAAKLVHRRTDPDDRRRILVFLAPRGRKRLEAVAPLVEKSYADLSPVLADELARTLSQVRELLN